MSVLSFEIPKTETSKTIELWKCEQCDRTFKTPTSLVSHLTHKTSPCKIDIKEYYDKYLKSPTEGICKFCNGPTLFYSIVKGYPSDVCKHCRNKRKSTQEKRQKSFDKSTEKRKKENGYYNFPEFCEICKLEGKDIRFKNRAGLSRHVSKIHKIKAKDYYDKYLKKPNEGICPITGEYTTFKNMNEGYCVYKGKGKNSADKIIQEKKKKTLLKNHGVENPVHANKEQRIEKFKKHFEDLRELKNARIDLISLLRKQTINKDDKTQCQICGLKFDKTHLLGGHLKYHNITAKEYYDKYLKINDEGICPISGLNTTFACIEIGYYKYHQSIITLTDEIKQGSKKSQLEYIHKKIKEDQFKYNVEFLDIKSFNYISDLKKCKCLKCNRIYKTRFTNLINGFGKCPKCYPKQSHRSKGEIQTYEFVKESVNMNVIHGYRDDSIKNPITGRNLELDIYIPTLNIAIEYNGIHWHSEKIHNDNAPIIHIRKYKLCKDNNIRLIQIFEDEWKYKQDIVKNMLLHRLGLNKNTKIYARNCYIKEIEPKIKNHFLDNNHIQGSDKSKIKLGLFRKDNDELISVMTFSGKNLSRGTINISDTDWELSRFATKLDYRVIGAAGKLLKYFQNNYEWSKIFSYADLRYSEGNLYEKLGFNKISQSHPNYWYVYQDRRIHRFNLRKRPDESKEIPEYILRQNEGYYRIWDCGHLKFELTNSMFALCKIE